MKTITSCVLSTLSFFAAISSVALPAWFLFGDLSNPLPAEWFLFGGLSTLTEVKSPHVFEFAVCSAARWLFGLCLYVVIPAGFMHGLQACARVVVVGWHQYVEEVRENIRWRLHKA